MNDKIFIVCIEINKQQLRKSFEQTIIGNHTPKKIMENVYAISAPYSFSSEQIRNQINGIFFDNCSVFVMKTSIDAAWRLDAALDVWLRSNI